MSEQSGTAFTVGDEHVRAVRRMVGAALAEARELSVDRGTRVMAEEFLRQEFKRTMPVLDRAREAYRNATVGPSGEEARRRAVELGAVRRAIDAGVQAQTPHLASVAATFQERLPDTSRVVLDSEAGALTRRASLETAARLIPPDPSRWDTAVRHRIEASDQFITDVAALQECNEHAATGLRRVTGTSTADPRGAALQIACYERMDSQQLQDSERWREQVRTTHSVADQKIERALTKTGVPPMPWAGGVALNMRYAQKGAQDIAMGTRASGADPAHMVPPPKPTQAPSVGMNRL